LATDSFKTAEMTLTVTQGHKQWHYLTVRMPFPDSIVTISLSRTVSEILAFVWRTCTWPPVNSRPL